MKTLIFLTLTLCMVTCINHIALAQTCDDPGAKELTRVYYVNGMNNESWEIISGKNRLETLLGGSPRYRFGYSTNTMEPALEQSLEVFRQRVSEKQDSRQFWQWIVNPKEAGLNALQRLWFDLFIKNAANIEYNKDPELRTMIDEYIQDLRSGKKVILVAHSQGNFYANNAYAYIVQRFPQYRDSIGIVAVGTPSGRVQDGGNHSNNEYDVVLYGLVRNIGGFPVLGHTFRYDEPDSFGDFNALLNHNFIKTYIKKDGANIRSYILATERRLTSPKPIPQCDPNTPKIRTDGVSNITSTSATVMATLTDGVKVDTWFILSDSASSANCTAGNRNGIGPDTAIKTISGTFGNLKPSTGYSYRGCAMGRNKKVISGAVRSFRTSSAPPPPPPPPPTTVPCGGNLSVSGGFQPYSTRIDLGTKSGNVYIEFQPFTIPDALEIKEVGGNRYYSGPVSATSSGSPWFANVNKKSSVRYWDVNVYPSPNLNTAWEVYISCPGSPILSPQAQNPEGNSSNSVFQLVDPSYPRELLQLPTRSEVDKPN